MKLDTCFLAWQHLPRRCPSCGSRAIEPRCGWIRCSNPDCGKSRYVTPRGLWKTRRCLAFWKTLGLWLLFIGQAALFAAFVAVWLVVIILVTAP